MSTVVVFVVIAVVHTVVTPTPAGFLVTAMVVVLLPGPGAVYAVSAAVTSGWRTGSLAAVGCTLGIVPHLVAALVGLSGAMQAGAAVYELVRWCGVAYLVFLAIGLLRSDGELLESPPDAATPTTWHILRRGVLLNVLNPKLTAFFVAFLPQFAAGSDGAVLPPLLGLSAVFVAMTLAVFLAYAAAAAQFRAGVLSRPKLVQRVQQSFGVVLVVFATRLATARP